MSNLYVQDSFDFPFADNYKVEDFLLSKENNHIVNFINEYDVKNPLSPHIFAIIGKAASGKTHLASIWQKKNDARFIDCNQINSARDPFYIGNNQFYIIEDVDQISDQKALFHIFNNIIQHNSYLLITSNQSLNDIDYQFLDLKSRLTNIFSLEIGNPDQELINMLLIKNLAKRQLQVSPAVVDYLIKNIERSYEAIDQVAKMLEFHCFENKVKITIPLVKKILGLYPNNK